VAGAEETCERVSYLCSSYVYLPFCARDLAPTRQDSDLLTVHLSVGPAGDTQPERDLLDLLKLDLVWVC